MSTGAPPVTVALRQAGPSDAEALAALHVAVWRETYAALAPEAALIQLDEARRLPGWQAHLAETGKTGKTGAAAGTIVAEVDGALAGVLRYGPASQPALGAGGEIKHLYVAGVHAGRGIGRALMRAGFEAMRKAGVEEVRLAVVEGNEPALGFYKALGGAVTGRFRDAGPLWKSENLIVHWTLAPEEKEGGE